MENSKFKVILPCLESEAPLSSCVGDGEEGEEVAAEAEEDVERVEDHGEGRGALVTCDRVIAGMQYLERRGIRVQVLDLGETISISLSALFPGVEHLYFDASFPEILLYAHGYKVFSDIWSTFGCSQMSQSVLDIYTRSARLYDPFPWKKLRTL